MDLAKSPITSQKLEGHTDGIRSVAFSPNGQFALTVSSDKTARLWKIEQIDSIVLVEDALLILKLIENEDSLKDDSQAFERLQAVVKEAQQQPQIIKIINDFLNGIKIPEKECNICTEKYDPETHICMQLPCCKQCICKVCLDRIGKMTYLTEFESYQFEDAVQKKCPYCNKPTNEMGIIKKFDTTKNGNQGNNHG